MNLKLIFKIGAVWLGMWAVMMLFAPDMANTYGFDLDAEMKSMMQGFGVTILSLAILHWTLQMWVEDNLPKFGQVADALLQLK